MITFSNAGLKAKSKGVLSFKFANLLFNKSVVKACEVLPIISLSAITYSKVSIKGDLNLLFTHKLSITFNSASVKIAVFSTAFIESFEIIEVSFLTKSNVSFSCCATTDMLKKKTVKIIS